MAPRYTLSRRSTVLPQPNRLACSTAPADSLARSAGEANSRRRASA